MKDMDYTTGEQVENYFEAKLLTIVDEVNKSAIVWQDVFDNGVSLYPETIVDVWRWVGPDWQTEVANVTAAGFRTIVAAPWYLNYISYGLDWPTYYLSDPQNFTGTQAQKDLIIGGEGCMWAEWVDGTNVIDRTFPRAGAVGERLWSASTVVDVTNAGLRMELLRCRLLGRGIRAEPAVGPSFCPIEFYVQGSYPANEAEKMKSVFFKA